MAFNRRNKRYLAGWGIMLLAGGGIGIALRTLVDLGTDRVSPSVMIAFMVPLAATAIAACLPWWRALDEMQKDAQLAGWYWGGTSGAILGVAVAIVLGGVHSDLFRGVLLMGGSQLACFVLCWIGWRVCHRARAA